MEYRGKKIWVTGASSGIGEALSLAFAKAGAYLILSGRNVLELERVRKGCAEGGALGVEVVRLDLGEHGALFEIARAVVSRLGSIDILVNNAGVSQRSLAKDTLFEVDQHIIAVDLLGTIALTKAVLPSMLTRRSGQIVVVSSVMGKFGGPLRSTYSAAKHGLHGFFDSLRAEVFDDGIKVLIVCPGFVRTNISLNAVVGDGSLQGTMDEATNKGLAPSVVAERIILAIGRGKDEIYLGGREIWGVYLKRFLPGFLGRVIRRAKVT